MDTEAIASRTKDCSKGFCSLYCPQWCYIIFPPPPPPPFEDFSDDQTSGQNFSAIVLTIIGFLAGALLLVSYYAIISKYCRNRLSPPSTTNDRNNHDADVEQDGDVGGPHSHEPWFVATNGLDEALIRSIKTFEYRRGEGLVEGTECSVCLSEFVEEEPLRLLPKCSHAFHVHCIDTWLECHSNCPLCRANVAAPNSSPPPPPSLPLLLRSDGEVESSHVAENLEIDIVRDREVEETNVSTPKTPRRDWQEDSRRDDEGNRQIRRSVSMDFLLCVINHDEDCERQESNRQRRSGENECEMRPIEMKRSYSSGRWFVSKWGKANAAIPF